MLPVYLMPFLRDNNDVHIFKTLLTDLWAYVYMSLHYECLILASNTSGRIGSRLDLQNVHTKAEANPDFIEHVSSPARWIKQANTHQVLLGI